MLSTLLQIGKTFRKSPDGLKHHRYVKHAPQRDPQNKKTVGNDTQFFRVPVDSDGHFDFAKHEGFDDENLIERLFYLNYKTTDADSTKKYIFGDIVRHVDLKTTKESGNFLCRKGTESSSFARSEKIALSIESKIIASFRKSFEEQLSDIISFLTEHPNCYIHFDFAGQHWYQMENAFEAINLSLLDNFTEKIAIDEVQARGRVLRKTLLRTLSSAVEGDSGRVANFTAEHEYKNFIFKTDEEVRDIFYAIDISETHAIRKGDVKIIVLPRGENLTAEQIERFFTRQYIETEIPKKKAQEVRDAAQQEQMGTVDSIDELFAAALEGTPKEDFVQFDFIFSKAGSASAPDIDMIEVSGLDRGLLEYISERVLKIRHEVETHRPKSGKIRPLSITQSFLNILGDSTKVKKKYQDHLFKVLPQIYTGTYYRDDILLPALIEKTEFNIRNDLGSNFGLLKFDFEFLIKIRNKGDRMNEIKSSPSYQVGFMLGQMAKPFSHSKTPIKSFEKNYVGLLSRRIATIEDLRDLGADVNEKLIMHEQEVIRDQKYFPRRALSDFFELLANFPINENYNRHDCAFGFFHSYSYLPPKKEANDGDAHQDVTDPSLDA